MSEHERTGRRRNRRPTEGCDRKPGSRIVPGNQISQQDLAERLLWEAAHDPAVRLTVDDAIMAGLVAEHAGRCHECGRVIGDADWCRFCGTAQATAGKRNASKRRTIGGFCGKGKA